MCRAPLGSKPLENRFMDAELSTSCGERQKQGQSMRSPYVWRSGVQMARRVVPRLDFFPRRLECLALRHGVWAARVKAAARGGMHGVRDFT